MVGLLLNHKKCTRNLRVSLSKNQRSRDQNIRKESEENLEISVDLELEKGENTVKSLNRSAKKKLTINNHPKTSKIELKKSFEISRSNLFSFTMSGAEDVNDCCSTMATFVCWTIVLVILIFLLVLLVKLVWNYV
jgi:hypothetical protein